MAWAKVCNNDSQLEIKTDDIWEWERRKQNQIPPTVTLSVREEGEFEHYNINKIHDRIGDVRYPAHRICYTACVYAKLCVNIYNHLRE